MLQVLILEVDPVKSGRVGQSTTLLPEGLPCHVKMGDEASDQLWW